MVILVILRVQHSEVHLVPPKSATTPAPASSTVRLVTYQIEKILNSANCFGDVMLAEYGKVGVVECLGEFRCPGLDFTGPYGKKSE